MSDVYFDAVKSDVYSDVYIYLGQLAGEGSRVKLSLNVRLRLKIAPAGWHVMLGRQVAGKQMILARQLEQSSASISHIKGA